MNKTQNEYEVFICNIDGRYYDAAHNPMMTQFGQVAGNQIKIIFDKDTGLIIRCEVVKP